MPRQGGTLTSMVTRGHKEVEDIGPAYGKSARTCQWVGFRCEKNEKTRCLVVYCGLVSPPWDTTGSMGRRTPAASLVQGPSLAVPHSHSWPLEAKSRRMGSELRDPPCFSHLSHGILSFCSFRAMKTGFAIKQTTP